MTPINKKILKQYLRQRNRGTMGFGVYDIKNKQLVKETTEAKIKKWVNKHNSPELLFHHRIPTSTPNVQNAAHPFSTKDYFDDKEYILIHNGVMRNEDELARKHDEMGIRYSSVQENGRFNDSEALLWDVALYLHGDQEKAQAVGTMAWICLEKDKNDPSKNNLFYYRNSGNPLFINNNKKTFMLSSEKIEGNFDMVVQDKLYRYNYGTDQTTTKDLVMPTYFYTAPSRTWNQLNEQENSRREAYEDEQRKYGGYGEETDDSLDYISTHIPDFQKLELLKKLKDRTQFVIDVKELTHKYLMDATLNAKPGYYELAVMALEDDFEQSYGDDILSVDDVYNEFLARAAVFGLQLDKNWVDSESIHPAFLKDDGSIENVFSKENLAAQLKLNYPVPSVPITPGTTVTPNLPLIIGESSNPAADILHERQSLTKKVADAINKRYAVERTPDLVHKIPEVPVGA